MLFHYWGDENKVTHSGITKRYDTNYVKTSYAMQPWYYEHIRHIKKSYSYVGMDEATARACYEAKRKQYRYAYCFEMIPVEGSGDSWNTGTLYVGNADAATISLVHGDADMWSVDIDVDQEDQLDYLEALSPDVVDRMFPTLNYDEGDPAGGLMMITEFRRRASASAHGTAYQCVLPFSVDIAGFSTTSTKLKAWGSNDGINWTRLTDVTFYTFNGETGANLGTYYKDPGSGSTLPKYADLPRRFCVTWGDSLVFDDLRIRSNAMPRPTDTPEPTTDSITASAPEAIGGMWHVSFVPSFETGWDWRGATVEHKLATELAWHNCDDYVPSASLTFNTGVAVEDPQPQTQFRVRYANPVTSQTTYSNVVSTVYDPASEAGDGTIAISYVTTATEQETECVLISCTHNSAWEDLSGAKVRIWDSANAAWSDEITPFQISEGSVYVNVSDLPTSYSGHVRVVFGEHGSPSCALPLADTASLADGIRVKFLSFDYDDGEEALAATVATNSTRWDSSDAKFLATTTAGQTWTLAATAEAVSAGVYSVTADDITVSGLLDPKTIVSVCVASGVGATLVSSLPVATPLQPNVEI